MKNTPNKKPRNLRLVAADKPLDPTAPPADWLRWHDHWDRVEGLVPACAFERMGMTPCGGRR